jgi:hypothetical protein
MELSYATRRMFSITLFSHYFRKITERTFDSETALSSNALYVTYWQFLITALTHTWRHLKASSHSSFSNAEIYGCNSLWLTYMK